MNTELPVSGHGEYKELKSFRLARLLYDVTVRFCNRFIEKHSQTHKRMVQAARSGVENIAEGYRLSADSIENELKLTIDAQANLEKLRLEYEEFLRHYNLPVWPHDDPRRKSLINRQCSTVDEVLLWVLQKQKRQPGASASLPEISANAAITLTLVASTHLGRQISALEKHSGLSQPK